MVILSAFKVLGLLLIALGLVQLGGNWLASRPVRQRRSWPCTMGKITFSGIKPISADEYAPDIRYVYVVERQICTGTQIGDYSIQGSKNEMLSFAAYYPVRRRVRVYYAPSDPQKAYLDVEPYTAPPLVKQSGMLILMGIVIVGSYYLVLH